jgi:hypothetical protein
VRNLKSRVGWKIKPNYFARENAEPFVFSSFIADIEKELQSEAYAQKRAIVFDPFTEETNQIPLMQFMNRISKGTHPRQDQVGSRPKFTPIATDERFTTCTGNTSLDTAKIPHLIIDDADRMSHFGSFLKCAALVESI